MTELALSDAWRLWSAGPLSPSTTIFHIELFVWARLGKVLQFLGAATILAEIIGTERLRAFGTSLHDIFSFQRAGELLRDVWIFYKSWVLVIVRKADSTEHKEAQKQLEATKTSNYWIALILLGLAIFLVYNWTDLNWWQLLLGALAAFFVLSLIGATIAAIAGLTCWLILLGAEAIVETAAWLLERPLLDRWIKLGAFLALVIGFHFDLLAS